MKIDIYVVEPKSRREVPADMWIQSKKATAYRANWLVIHASGHAPFLIHKDNLYPKCETRDFFDSFATASHNNCRLGTEEEWRIVHEAKNHHNLDQILAAIAGEVVASKLTFTENGTVVRSFICDGRMESFEIAALPAGTEIFARNFKSHI